MHRPVGQEFTAALDRLTPEERAVSFAEQIEQIEQREAETRRRETRIAEG